MKPPILFRPALLDDIRLFTRETSYWPGAQFNGIVAYMVKDGRPMRMGMVGFDGWTPRTVMAHWWIRYPRCIEPLWFECVAYIAQTGRKSILGATPGNNTKALKAIRHLGWVEKYRIQDAWDEGVDVVISEYPIHVAINSSTAAARRTA